MLTRNAIAAIFQVWYISTMGNHENNKLTPDKQHELRQKVIELHKRKKSIEIIEKKTGYCSKQIKEIIKRYGSGGDAALEPQKRGPKFGSGKLSLDQAGRMRTILLMKTPSHFGNDICLWTRRDIQLAISQKFGIVVSERTITDYLNRWGFSLDDVERSKRETVKKKFMQTPEYSELLARSKKERFEIYWGGGSSSRRIKAIGGCCSTISATSNRKHNRFMAFRGDITEETFYDFLRRLDEDVKTTVLLILWGEYAFKSEALNSRIRSSGLDIELYYLEDQLKA